MESYHEALVAHYPPRMDGDGAYCVDVPFSFGKEGEAQLVVFEYQFALEHYEHLPIGRVQRSSEAPFIPRMIRLDACEVVEVHQMSAPGHPAMLNERVAGSGFCLKYAEEIPVDWPVVRVGDRYMFNLKHIMGARKYGRIRMLGYPCPARSLRDHCVHRL